MKAEDETLHSCALSDRPRGKPQARRSRPAPVLGGLLERNGAGVAREARGRARLSVAYPNYDAEAFRGSSIEAMRDKDRASEYVLLILIGLVLAYGLWKIISAK